MGEAEPVETIRLLWRDHLPRETSSRGPKRRHDLTDLVDRAIALADAKGLGAVSMRELASDAAMSVMSLYTYVSSREQLVALMVDRALARTSLPSQSADLREGIESVARSAYAEHLRHPWLSEAMGARPGLGPGAYRRYEWQLEALAALDLDDVALDQAVTLLTAFAGNLAGRRHAVMSQVEDQAWWESVGPTLSLLVDARDYPLAHRVGSAAGAAYNAAQDADLEFEFGLHCIVDGLLGRAGTAQPSHTSSVANQADEALGQR